MNRVELKQADDPKQMLSISFRTLLDETQDVGDEARVTALMRLLAIHNGPDADMLNELLQ